MTARTGSRLLLRPELWGALWLVTSLVLILFPTATQVALSKTWLWLTALTISSLLLLPLHIRPRGHAPGWAALVAVVLPSSEREQWVAEAAAVLAATEPGPEHRHQALRYLRALPATAVTVWALKIRYELTARRGRQ